MLKFNVCLCQLNRPKSITTFFVQSEAHYSTRVDPLVMPCRIKMWEYRKSP